MRALLALLLLAQPAAAQQGVRPAPADPAAELAATRRALDEARAELQRLRLASSEAQGTSAALAECRARNDRLVVIGQDLVAAYERRYGRGRAGPFQLGRARFEAELQATGDEIHRNRVDAAPARPAEPAAGAAPR